MLHNAVILMCALAAGAVPAGRHPSHPPFTAGTTFRVDIGAARRALHALAPDDRPNQVADWAVIGALYRSGLPQDDIRKALYDKVPLRDPALEEVASFDYGPGRHVNLQNETWLFRPEADPHPAATLGRLADQARLELGSIPRQLAVFTYRSDLPRGQIQVTLQARVPGPSLFRPAAGYVEQDVSTIGELSDWLESVDDVTYVSLLGGGQVRFGGRRFEDHRTPGATLDDLAALAHAQQAIQDDRRSRPDPARVITLFNQGLDHARSGALGKAADALDAADQELSRIDGGGREGAVRAEGGSRASPEVLRPRFDALRARIDHVREHWEEYAARLAARSKPLPPEPGFSLDPAWDARPLSRDLANLALHPRDLVRQAVEIARTVEGNPADHDALPIESHAAVKVAAAAWAQTRNLGNARDWQPQLSAAQAAVVRQSTDLWKSGDVEKAGMVIFANVRSWRAGGAVPEPSPTVSEDLFGALTEFVMARSQVQCARYDGPLKGTHVGMVLFYTDLMAKVWASVDYHHSAPVDDVDGFRSEPRISSAVEPIYWPEIERLSSTRLWFG
ncbi:MAG TPA: hypothetical protein VND93_09835, partial [Myxococcales bacterium]|nr:hypothetical protein [Myxococcales bacterium]